MIRIEITHGSQFVSQQDIERAEVAAIMSLGVDGIDTPEKAAAARAEFLAAAETGEMPGEMSKPGPWEKAQQQASIALTEGWHNPEGADLILELA